MAKSEKNIIKDIFRAQGIYVHGDIPEPTPEAIKVLSDYGFERWREGDDNARYEDDDY